MTSHSKKILEKMKLPTYSERSFEFAYHLTNESERGAILIGTSKVEEFLTKLIQSILPYESKSYINRLFKYPGPLSSFSAKIELPYSFRIFDEKLYTSLNTLRQIRNIAAHSSQGFSLNKVASELNIVNDFEQDFPEVIHELSFENLIIWKKEQFKQLIIKDGLEHLDYTSVWNERISKPRENVEILKQHLIWKLAYGLTMLTLKLEIITDEYNIIKNTNKVWYSLLTEND